MKILKFTLILMLYSSLVFGQENIFSIGGEIRNRAEFRDGYGTLLTPQQDPTFFNAQRNRIILDASYQNFIVKLTLQDLRIWGESVYGSTGNDNNSLDFYEAWIKYKFSEKWALKFGRQEITYDDGRIFSSSVFKNTSVTHDAAVLIYENKEKNMEFHLGAVGTNSKEDNYLNSYSLNQYKYLGFAWFGKKISDNFKFSLIDIADGNQKANTNGTVYLRNTAGTNFTASYLGFELTGIFYTQNGKIKDGRDVNANFYSLNFSYKYGKLKATAAYDHYSGSDITNSKYSEESNSFDKLFGTGHTFLGYMDYIASNIPNDTKNAGVNDLIGQLKFKFSDKLNLETTFHLFSLDKENITNASNSVVKVDKLLGSEVDLMLIYSPNKTITINTAYCFMLQKESMEILKNVAKDQSRFPQWFYLMITFKPTFFTTKKE